jgi:uncharacterized protein YceH (UPF0502 family)
MPVNIQLSPTEARVLGALVEKEITTPEYYPLSLNALLNACNQKSNREPVTNLDEDAVRQALHSLDRHGLARSAATDGRVPKFEHRLQEAFNFHRHEIANLCVLLLRGPQTPGELRSRTERMYHFEDLSTVQSSLHHLMNREPPLVMVLPRQPGTKEARYVHLLAGDAEVVAAKFASRSETDQETQDAAANGDRLAQLERELAALRNDIVSVRHENSELRKVVGELLQQFAVFRKQFE